MRSIVRFTIIFALLVFDRHSLNSQSLYLPDVSEVHNLATQEKVAAGAGASGDLCNFSDPNMHDACVAAQVVEFNYSAERITHRRDVLAWQLLAGKLIFFIVLLLVLAGLTFAYLQFRLAVTPAQRTLVISDMQRELVSQDKQTSGVQTGGASATADDAVSERGSGTEIPAADLEIGLQKIKVSSSILGVIILAFSMAFFYLYLVYVFPVRELATAAQ
jgi:hypothetical protein